MVAAVGRGWSPANMPSSVPLLALPLRQLLFIIRCVTARKVTNLVPRHRHVNQVSDEHRQRGTAGTVLSFSGAHLPRPTILSASGPTGSPGPMRYGDMCTVYKAENVFWVPKEGRWSHLQANAKQPIIGKVVDDAMVAIRRDRSNATTRRLAVMNLALRGIEADFGPEQADTFRRDLHPDLRADYVLANPPFNDSDWFRKDDDVRWQFGIPPKGNANFAWVSHFIHHLAPSGMAGFVLTNGSMSSNQSGEGDMRRAIIEADLVDCMVAMPGQLFYSTQIPVCLWFLAKNKNDGKRRDRRKQTLFLDARKLGTLIDRVHRELTDVDLEKIVDTYHAWRGDRGAGKYKDIAGSCKSATTAEIATHGYVLTPGRYVRAEEVADDGEPFAEKIARLVGEPSGQFAEGAKLEKAIKANLKGLGYGS